MLLQTIAPLLTVDVTIDRSLLRLVVDTGAPALALFTNRLQSRLPGFRLKGVSGAHGPGGSFRLRDVELSAVRLGPMEWRRVPGLLADVSASSFEADGVLGPRSLRVKRIGFDFVRRRLSWEK